MFRSVLAIALGVASVSAMAQMSPVGLWQTISDKDGKVTSEVRIVETGGVLSGKIEKVLTATAKPDDKCTACKDERKDQLIVGLEFIRGAKKADDKNLWEGGNILDPENGTVYKLRLTPIEDGKKLEVRGYVGAPLFGRTQTWVRVQ